MTADLEGFQQIKSRLYLHSDLFSTCSLLSSSCTQGYEYMASSSTAAR